MIYYIIYSISSFNDDLQDYRELYTHNHRYFLNSFRGNHELLEGNKNILCVAAITNFSVTVKPRVCLLRSGYRASNTWASPISLASVRVPVDDSGQSGPVI